ncbi:SDR family oxidoreductase [Pedobacter sp. P351]|uniref:NAD-dependent epimerase/dehydratase family protein n=1 Tax=Pedobacter superstes TaxID=3133441 RepID=UPI0030B34105
MINEIESKTTSKTKVLLIGSTGKLGKGVLNELITHNDTLEVRLLVRKANGTAAHQNLIKYHGDLLFDDINPSIQWADIILNCSGMVSYRAEDARNLQSVNVQGVRNLITSCERFNKPLIHTGSAIAYGSSVVPICFSEEFDEQNVYRGNYAQSKFEADQLIIASKIPYVILRPSTLISTLTNLYNFYKKGFIADLRGGASFAQIEEVAKAYVSAIDLLIKSPSQYIFNLGGNNLAFSAVFDCFNELDYRRTRLVKKPFLSALSLVNDNFLNPVFNISILTRDNYLTGNRYTFLNSSKAIEHLNYTISPFEHSVKNILLYDHYRRRNP